MAECRGRLLVAALAVFEASDMPVALSSVVTAAALYLLLLQWEARREEGYLLRVHGGHTPTIVLESADSCRGSG